MKIYITQEKIELFKFLTNDKLNYYWFSPDQLNFNCHEVVKFMEFFFDYKLYLWTFLKGCSSSEKINDIKRAFGEWPKLKKNTIYKEDLVINNLKYYYDIAEIDLTNINEGVNFLYRSLFGADSSLFFTKGKVTEITQELIDIRKFDFTEKVNDCFEIREYKEKLLLYYINKCISNNTIPVIVVNDSNQKQYFVTIVQINNELYNLKNIELINEDEFQRWINIGLDIRCLI